MGARGKKFGGALEGEEGGEIFGSPHNVPPSRAARRKKEEGQGQGRTEWEWAVPGSGGKKKEKRGGETPAKKRFLPACEEERHEEEEEEEERKLIPSLLYRPVLEEDNTHQFFSFGGLEDFRRPLVSALVSLNFPDLLQTRPNI